MDSSHFFENLQEFNNRYMEAMQLLCQKKLDISSNPLIDIESIQKLYLEAVTSFTKDPARFMQHNLEYIGHMSKLMLNLMGSFSGKKVEQIFETQTRDKRFKNDAWQNSLYFNFLKQFYIMSADWYRSLVQKLEVSGEQKKLLMFYTEQLLNAACPANFANFNPEVINEIIATNGKNLLQGVENFIEDIKNSENLLSITTADHENFKIGKNIASTEGKVIFQNDLMQLIYYKPKDEVFSIPLLIIPPWINKYYILDLSPENSFIKYLVSQNFQVFLVSWINPGKHLASKNFEDYLKEGIIEPIEFIQNQFKYHKFNILGYCLGGTLAVAAEAYFAAKNKDPIVSGTLLTTMLDFSEPGDLGLFINRETIEAIKHELQKTGYFNGKYMAYAFSLLRANELIWSFVINNYLLGKKPMAFDLLFWNADNTNLPAAMHSYYLEKMYIDNALICKDALEMLGVKIDLSKITVPNFFLATQDDHIAPWESVFSGIKYIGNKTMQNMFCLAGSGHIAGVINPPKQRKYNYWINQGSLETASSWIRQAQEKKGSWWDYWASWIKEKSGDMIKAPSYDKINYIEKAPGSYVRVRN